MSRIVGIVLVVLGMAGIYLNLEYAGWILFIGLIASILTVEHK